jgi:DUF1365 family protein
LSHLDLDGQVVKQQMKEEGVILQPTHKWRNKASSFLDGLLGDRRVFVKSKKYFHAPIAMQIAWHLKIIAAALLVLNLRSILRALPPLVQHQNTTLIVAVIALFAAWLFLHNDAQMQQRGEGGRPCLWQGQYQTPKIFECQTTHTRLFPKKHSFSYSYLLVGVPIGWRGAAGPIISSDLASSHGSATSSKTWFSVHAEDYLERGGHVDGLAGKLKDYLTAQNASIDDYPYAYLVTAPRFLGFSFNPVSFWYLYDRTKNLAAMILEVNNTFDERRMYFLPRQGTGNAASTNFAQQWNKDFHVSPFNDRDGSYNLSAIDPFEMNGEVEGKIDNTIILRSDDCKPKVIARVFSTNPGMLPTNMSELGTFIFLARWWWVGFMTNPRILREARVLWVKGLRIFYRPEVMITSIGRNPTTEEDTIEPFFHSWLQRLSNVSETVIKYTPAANHKRTTTIYPETEAYHHQDVATEEALDVKILTPAWYAGLARNPDLPRGFDQFSFNAVSGQAIAHVSSPERFHRILEKFKHDVVPPSVVGIRSCIIHLLRLGSCGMLAVRVQGQYRSASTSPNISTPNQGVDFDEYVKSTADSQQLLEYEQACLKILLADRFAFGWTSLLRFYVRIVRMGFLISTVFHLHQWINGTQGSRIWDVFSLAMKVLVLLVIG